MAFSPKMLALDIDGTLIDFDRRLPAEARAAVARAAEKVPVVLATGRSWQDTGEIIDQLGLPPGWAVCTNGATVLSHPDVQIHREVSFDARECVEVVLKHRPEALLAVDRGLERLCNQPFPEGEFSGEVQVVPLAELVSEPVSRLVIREPGAADDDTVFDGLLSELGMHEVGYFVGCSAWLDIAPLGVDKSSGLQFVCDQLGIAASDVLALGDGRNDIEMLRWAGRGVALGDAPDVVRAAADHVTGRFADLGTPEELNRWW